MSEKIYWIKVRKQYEEIKEVTAGDEREARRMAEDGFGETIESTPVGSMEIVSITEKEALG